MGPSVADSKDPAGNVLWPCPRSVAAFRSWPASAADAAAGTILAAVGVKVVRKPERIDPLADKILRRLSARPEASEIILGGYFALQHYTDYRKTRDIDAWWRTRALPTTEAAIRTVLREVADEEGYTVQERRFGETSSFELWREGKKRFSFQIAVRSVELEPPVPSPWPPILMETLRDNIGAKMNALADRGAPRDFIDIMQVVTSGLISAAECWSLWMKKNAGQPVDSARQKVLHHVSALDLRRPLSSIADVEERSRAQHTRDWFRNVFLQAST